MSINQLDTEEDLIGKKVILKIHNYYTVPKGAKGVISNVRCFTDNNVRYCSFSVHFDRPSYNISNIDWRFSMDKLDQYFEVT